MFTNGAVTVNSSGLSGRIVANVFIWTFLLYGLFFLAAFQDSAMGVSLAFLVAGQEPTTMYSLLISLTLHRSARRSATLH